MSFQQSFKEGIVKALQPYWDTEAPLRLLPQRIMRHTRTNVNRILKKCCTEHGVQPEVLALLLPPTMAVINSPFETTFSLLDPTIEDYDPSANPPPAAQFPMVFSPPVFKIFRFVIKSFHGF